MTGSYDIWLVILSVVVASIASYVALDLASRVVASRTVKAKRYWLVGGSLSMGMGIWSMHFVGMLAFRLPIPMSYDVPITLLSLLIAVLLSGFALSTVSHGILGPRRLLWAGCLMGGGIAAMHYTGMAAMQMLPPIRYDPLLFTLSIAIAIVVSMVALWIVFRLRTETTLTAFWKRSGSALVMGGAIAGMHYTGMAAAIIAPNSICTVNPQFINNTWLAATIAGCSFAFLGASLLISVFDERMADRTASAAETLRLANAALKSRTAELSRSNTLLGHHVRVLELIASGISLSETLREITQLVEHEVAEMLCSIMLLDETGTRLGCTVAPSLPKEYTAAIDNLAIGPDVGSCGTAAFLKELVIVRDIATDPKWKSYRDLGLRHNLRACWSEPIVASSGQVLGTFAMYYRQPQDPNERELALIKGASSLAGIAIERTRAEQEIRKLAFYDTLTGLPNRYLLKELLARAIAQAKRQGNPIAVMYLDLDGFKRINDTFGHSLGDKLLQSVAERVTRSVRESDGFSRGAEDDQPISAARLGGDEFTLWSSNLRQREDAVRVAQRIIDAVARPMVLDGHEVTVTTSVGIALYPDDGADVETLLKCADAAMYQAKDSGRNRLEFYSQEMQRAAAVGLALEHDLRAALEKREFVLYYQPQFSDIERRIVGLEALIRWRHPQRGLVPPSEFIPVAEETGLIAAIDEWVILTACAQSKAWQDSGMEAVPVAVNLSASLLRRSELPGAVRRILAAVGLAPAWLELELTESVLVRDVESAIDVLHGLKSVGVKLALDDFGTGYSSLNYLKRFPLDTLKIDRSFVRDIHANHGGAIITKTIIAMGQALNMRVIAEGVESEAQAAVLRDHGCQLMQGFLFGRPLPAEDLVHLLSRAPHADAGAA